MEIWRDIKGYEGLYQVSDHGRIKKLRRCVLTKNNKTLEYAEQILKPGANSSGYYRVVLIDAEGKKKKHFVHRLVAYSFCPEKPYCDIVNHKDCDPTNNRASNLEWTTQSENIQHAVKLGRMNFSEKWYERQDGASKSRPVIGMNILTGETIRYNSISDAKRDGFNAADIGFCCKGERVSHKGFVWAYADKGVCNGKEHFTR